MKIRPEVKARRRTGKALHQLELSYKLHAFEKCLSGVGNIADSLANEKRRTKHYSALAKSINTVLDSLHTQQNAAVGSQKEMWANAHRRLTRCLDTITYILEKGPASITVELWGEGSIRNLRFTGPTSQSEVHDFAKLLKKLNKQIDGSLRFIYDILNTRQAAEGD